MNNYYSFHSPHTDEVDCDKFYDNLNMSVIWKGVSGCSDKDLNVFYLPQSYSNWPPRIPKKNRKSHMVINTERQKRTSCSTNPIDNPDSESSLAITEDQLFYLYR